MGPLGHEARTKSKTIFGIVSILIADDVTGRQELAILIDARIIPMCTCWLDAHHCREIGDIEKNPTIY